MCGIVAVINKWSNGFTSRQVDIFTCLLWLDTLRGEDSTGVFMVNTLGNVEICKSTDIAQDFINQEEYAALAKKAIRDGFALVGHNRKATRGKITDENAHPFWVKEEVVLVHNGSFVGEHKHIKDTEVDSHALAHHLAEGYQDVEAALSKINAAYATVWWDFRTKTLNIIRNSQRPLHYVETHDSFYIASEACMLDFVVSRYDLKGVDQKPPTTYSFIDYQLQEFPLKDKKLGTIRSTDLPGAKYVYPTTVVTTQMGTYRGRRCHHFAGEVFPAEDAGEEWDAYATSVVSAAASPPTPPVNVISLPLPTYQKVNSGEEDPLDLETSQEAMELSFRFHDENTRRFTYSDWTSIEKGQYAKNNTVRGIVVDSIETTGGWFFVCKLLDSNRQSGVVRVPKIMFDELTSPNCKDPVLEFKIRLCAWRKLPDQTARDFNNALGMLAIVGRDAVILDNGLETITC